MEIKYTTFDSVSFCGYEQKTTFYMDFGIADAFGTKAVKDTYKRAMDAWKDDVVFLTELVLVLNWKSWEHAEKRPDLSKVYVDLYYKASDYALDHLKGDDLSYFFETTD